MDGDLNAQKQKPLFGKWEKKFLSWCWRCCCCKTSFSFFYLLTIIFRFVAAKQQQPLWFPENKDHYLGVMYSHVTSKWFMVLFLDCLQRNQKCHLLHSLYRAKKCIPRILRKPSSLFSLLLCSLNIIIIIIIFIATIVLPRVYQRYHGYHRSINSHSFLLFFWMFPSLFFTVLYLSSQSIWRNIIQNII